MQCLYLLDDIKGASQVFYLLSQFQVRCCRSVTLTTQPCDVDALLLASTISDVIR